MQYYMTVKEFKKKIFDTQGVRLKLPINNSFILVEDACFRRVIDAVTIDDFLSFLWHHSKLIDKWTVMDMCITTMSHNKKQHWIDKYGL